MKIKTLGCLLHSFVFRYLVATPFICALLPVPEYLHGVLKHAPPEPIYLLTCEPWDLPPPDFRSGMEQCFMQSVFS